MKNNKFKEKQMIKDNTVFVLFITCLVFGLGVLIQNHIFHGFKIKYVFIIPTVLGLHKINNYFVFIKDGLKSVVINDVRYYLRGIFWSEIYIIPADDNWGTRTFTPNADKTVKYYHAKSEFGDFVVIRLEYISFIGEGRGLSRDEKSEGRHFPKNNDYRISSVKEAEEEQRIYLLNKEKSRLEEEIENRRKNLNSLTSREVKKINDSCEPIRKEIERLEREIKK